MSKQYSRYINPQKNKGFTLIEMIVVVAIIAILITVAAIGVKFYIDSADKNERDHVAEVSFLAIQNHLTELKREGKLTEFNTLVNNYSGHVAELTCTGQLQTILENYYSSSDYAVNYPKFCENHENSHIVSVTFSSADKNNPFYNVLFNGLGNEDQLERAFTIEYNQTTGVVMSVFYSKSIESFNLGSMYNAADLTNPGNVILRDEASLDAKLQGYYGIINTALNGIEVPPVDEEVENSLAFVNSDRVYLTFNDKTLLESPGKNVSYVVTLHVTGNDGQTVDLPAITYNASEMYTEAYTKNVSLAIDHVDARDHATPDAQRAVRLTSYTGTKGTTDKYFLILDCDDLYKLNAGLRYDFENGKYVADISSLNTPVQQLSVTASMEIYADGVIQGEPLFFPEAINPVFAFYDKDYDYYGVGCTRHLDNIRDYTNNQKYILSDNVNLLQFEREEFNEAWVKNEELGTVYFNMSDQEVMDLTGTLGDASNRHCFANFDPIKCDDVAGIQQDRNVILEYMIDHRKLYTLAVNGKNGFERDANGNYRLYGSVVESVASSTGASGKAVVFAGMLIGVKNPDDALLSSLNRVCTPSSAPADYEGIDQLLSNISQDQCYKITGIYSNNNSQNFSGMFQFLSETAVVGGLSLENCDVTGRSNVGVLCGINSGHVNGVFAKDISCHGRYYLGGLIGRCEASVSNLHITGDLIVENTTKTGDDSYFQPIGGMFGSVLYDTYLTHLLEKSPDYIRVTNCTVDCDLEIVESEKTKAVGGLAGEAVAWFDSCSVTARSGHVSGYCDTGGFVGKLYAGQLNNCNVDVCRISPKNGTFCGGFIGSCGDFSTTRIYKDRILPIASTFGTYDNMPGDTVVIRNSNVSATTNVVVPDGKAANRVGGMAGSCINLAVLDSSCAANVIMENYTGGTTMSRVGGIVGTSPFDVVLSGATYSGNIYAENAVSLDRCGGLVGSMTFREPKEDNPRREFDRVYSLTVDHCTFSGTLASDLYGAPAGNIKNTGLILGYVLDDESDGYIINISNSQVVSRDGAKNFYSNTSLTQVGGIVGYVDCKNKDTILNITNCTYNANIETPKSFTDVGGCVGKIDAHVLANINGCLVQGTLVSGGNMTTTGGAIGKMMEGSIASIQACEVKGNIISGGTMTTTGGVVGYSAGGKLDISSFADGSVTCLIKSNTSISSAGGFVGGATGNTTIKDVVFNGTIQSGTSMTSAGGIIGYFGDTSASAVVLSNLEINNVLSKGVAIVAGSSITKTGGVVGQIYKSVQSEINISTAVNETPITSTTTMNTSGGILGYHQGVETVYITDSKNIGEIYAIDAMNNSSNLSGVGGIAGYSENAYCNITSCVNGGYIHTDSSMTHVGGIMGKGICKISDCQVTAELNAKTGMNGVGGFLGMSYDKNAVGLTSYLSNLTFNTSITNTTDGDINNTGGIVGRAETPITLSDLQVNEGGHIENLGIKTVKQTGGIIGSSKSLVTMTNLNNYSESACIESATSLQDCGGIFGYYEGRDELTLDGASAKCIIVSHNGNVSNTGGIFGRTTVGVVNLNNCTYEGTIEATGTVQKSGGILGYGTLICSFKDCNYSGTITASKNVNQTGGIVGYGAGNFQGCVNSGTIKANNGMSAVGGIAGEIAVSGSGTYTSTFKDCEVKSEEWVNNSSAGILKNVGGVVGYHSSATNFANVNIEVDGFKLSSKFTNETNGKIESIGGVVGRYNNANASLSVENISASDFTLDISTVGDAKWIGGCVGYVSGASDVSVKNSSVAGNIAIPGSIENGIAGIVGRSDAAISIAGCSSSINISSNGASMSYCGGILGYGKYAVNISDSTNTGKLEAKGTILYSGGIAGIAGDISGRSNFTNVTNNGAIISNSTGTSKILGGIVGRVGPTGTSTDTGITMQNCINRGDILCAQGTLEDTGGLCGRVRLDSASLVKNNYSVGNISYLKVNTNRLGGLFGYLNTASNANIKDNYFGGSITGTGANVGGSYIVGYIDGTDDLVFNYCYALGSLANFKVGAKGYYGTFKTQSALNDSIFFYSETPGTHNDFIIDATEFAEVVDIKNGDKTHAFSTSMEENIIYILTLDEASTITAEEIRNPGAIPPLAMSPFGFAPLGLAPLAELDDEASLSENSASENSASENSASANSPSANSPSGNEASQSGTPEGTPEGTPAGSQDGTPLGTPGGSQNGTPDGSQDGTPGGSQGGTPDGSQDGTPGGSQEGTPDGSQDGTPSGGQDGTPDGTPDGS